MTLLAQRAGVSNKRAARSTLLATTKGQEAAFQRSLAVTNKARAAAWSSYWAAQQRPASGGSSYSGGAGNGYLSWPSGGYVTQEYGMTAFARSGAYNGNIHNGVDTSCGWACPIRAAAAGQVIGRGYDGGWGNYILIRHPNGLVTLYAHLSSSLVGNGQSVAKGQQIGREGSTGFSTGSHLHFSVYTNITLYSGSFSYGITANPRNYL
jgi:murein DD-endopeptidase MepM/ murein hydrolase activator NlpD